MHTDTYIGHTQTHIHIHMHTYNIYMCVNIHGFICTYTCSYIHAHTCSPSVKTERLNCSTFKETSVIVSEGT